MAMIFSKNTHKKTSMISEDITTDRAASFVNVVVAYDADADADANIYISYAYT